VRRTITLFEHECTTGFGWTDRDLSALDRLNAAAGDELLRAVVRGGNRELRAGQHVGVIRLGSRTVQVLPKIYSGDGTDEPGPRAREATRNLLHLLRVAGDLPVREQGLASLLRRGTDWFEILTHLFATHLREEWQRGASRGYVVVDDDQPTLKGRWRVADQIRRPGRDHVFAVAFDEFTADVPLNRVFRFVVERLWGVTRDADNRRLLEELRQWLDEVTLLPSLTAAAGPGLLTRLNRRLEPLLNLARLFLDGGAIQLAAGDLTSFAFVFDMNRVFEAFLVNFVRAHRWEVLPPEWRRCDLLPQARGASLCLARSAEKPMFRLKPDLVVRDGGRFPLLMDAKYKRLDASAAGGGVGQADFHQMFAYAHRYDCPRVVMLYPHTAAMPAAQDREFLLEGTGGTTVAIATVDLRVDLGRAECRRTLTGRLRQVFQSGGPRRE
jgi:5-methylcytosine-specific restriction enzyme subunit McrC